MNIIILKLDNQNRLLNCDWIFFISLQITGMRIATCLTV